jgi:protein TonB
MFIQPRERTRNTGRIAWSVLLHLAVLAVIFHPVQKVRVRASLPGTAAGSHIELTYLPGGASAPIPNRDKSAPARAAKPKAEPKRDIDLALVKIVPPPLAKTAPQQNTSSVSATPSSGQSGLASNDALGNDDIKIALTTYSPSPKPDLSQLPHGTEGDVVLDVTIDPTGNVADLQILRSLGYGVEGKIVDTVRTWKFQPTTKDGIPVASVQELHFHYGPV